MNQERDASQSIPNESPYFKKSPNQLNLGTEGETMSDISDSGMINQDLGQIVKLVGAGPTSVTQSDSTKKSLNLEGTQEES